MDNLPPSYSDVAKIFTIHGVNEKTSPVIQIEQDDPWAISNIYTEITPWKELSGCGKFQRIAWDFVGKVVLLIGFLYFFICSLDFLSVAFKLIGGKAAGQVFSENQILSNPVAGLMIGILATVLLQSSSTTTSIVVSMVAAKIIPVKNAISMVMGANIGTSVTNTLVSLGQITVKNDFRRAFAGATVHDMFNWLTVIVLLPIEAASGFLYRLTDFLVSTMDLSTKKNADKEFLTKLTHPFTNLILQVDKKVVEEIAHGGNEATNKSMIKSCCLETKVAVTHWNITDFGNTSFTKMENVCEKKCQFLFAGVADKWSDTTIGIILLVIALVTLCVCLVLLVKTINSLLQGKISVLIKKFVNAELPGKFSYFTGYIAILVGTGLTILVQSSSVFTSALTPLVGIGVVSIDRMYPLTLGSNIGTTTTAIMAALSQTAEDIPLALQISMCHLFFNISGILLFYPIPYFRFPISLAKSLGNHTAKYRWFAIVYIILVFFLLPAAVFSLSLVSWKAMTGVCTPLVLILLLVIIINILQRKRPKYLPKVLRSWHFLPEPLRSLQPYDSVMKKICCSCCKLENNEGDSISDIVTEKSSITTTTPL